MYTENYDENTNVDDNYDYQEEEVKQSFWNTNKSLIIKIAIIILCLIILIWLFAKLKGNSKEKEIVNNNGSVYESNVEVIRIAMEKYFFIDGNLPSAGEVKSVTLDEMGKLGLVSNIVDYNQKACDGKSYASLVKGDDVYTLTINLSCETENKPYDFYYNITNKACMNCTGFTYMDGTNYNENDENSDLDPEEEFINNLSCTTWSDWTSQKITSSLIDVRSRVLVKGELKGSSTQIVYGEWSEYTKDPITPRDDIEVEMTTKQEQVWVNKTSSTKVSNSDTVKLISTSTVGGGSYTTCPSGYTKDGSKCSKTETGDLTYSQYNSYTVLNKPCASVYNRKNSDGTYTMMYKACQYKVYTDPVTKYYSSSTVYNYQELVTTNVNYYRFRSKSIQEVSDSSKYTDYMLEEELPSGYTKVIGSEKTEYSYKLNACEK